MSLVLQIVVKESLPELRKLLRQSLPMMQPRLKMLMLIKQAGDQGISKRELMSLTGACSQSIHNWRTLYKSGGITSLLANGRIGKAGKPSVFTKKEHELIGEKLRDPNNGFAGYMELQAWIGQEFKKEVKYNTVLKYAMKHFKSKVKVARKTHVKKDEQAAVTFKKTSSKR